MGPGTVLDSSLASSEGAGAGEEVALRCRFLGGLLEEELVMVAWGVYSSSSVSMLRVGGRG